MLFGRYPHKSYELSQNRLILHWDPQSVARSRYKLRLQCTQRRSKKICATLGDDEFIRQLEWLGLVIWENAKCHPIVLITRLNGLTILTNLGKVISSIHASAKARNSPMGSCPIGKFGAPWPCGIGGKFSLLHQPVFNGLRDFFLFQEGRHLRLCMNSNPTNRLLW